MGSPCSRSCYLLRANKHHELSLFDHSKAKNGDPRPYLETNTGDEKRRDHPSIHTLFQETNAQHDTTRRY
jgi:hypothetical protein